MSEPDKHDRSLLYKLTLKNPWHFLVLGFGSGLAPKAPGTFGSLAALPFCMALVYAPFWLQLLTVALTTVVGTVACNKAEQALGVHDNSALVIDEFAGMFVAILWYPALWFTPILAFVLFRFFDIMKPYPVSVVDRRVKGGLGVMADDLVAGLYALIAGHLALYELFNLETGLSTLVVAG